MAASPERYIKFIQQLSTTSGKWAGRPFQLRPFQRELIHGIFKREYDYEEKRWKRIIREAVVGVGRKNGKTELIAAIALASLVIEGERGGLVVVAAAKREQAALLLTAAKRMVLQSKIRGVPLSNFITVRRDSIYFAPLDATLKCIAADAQKEHGLNPHLVIVDEGHATMEKDRELYDTLLTAQGAREDPLAIVITTAGPAPKGPMYDLYKYGVEVQEGKREDPNFYMRWYSAAPGAAVDDPEAWKEANPALGEFLPKEFFVKTSQAVLSGRMPEFMYRRLHLNQWTTASERWLDFRKIDIASAKEPEIPEGADVYIGIDAAIKRDTFAVSVVHRDEFGVAHILAKRFVPGIEGTYIDVDEVVTYVLGLAARYNITKLVYDPAYFGLAANTLAERGVNVEAFPQSPERMADATETFQRLFLDEVIHIGENKDLLEHISSIAIKPTERGVRISKLKSTMPVDMAIATAMALQSLYGTPEEGFFAFIA